MVGEIVAMGKRVDAKWRLGVRVIAANSAPCFRCYHCRRGQENLCDDLLFNNGAYAEYMRIPGRIVREICWKYRIPWMTTARRWASRWRACSRNS